MMNAMAQRVWLTAMQERTWLNYMGVYHRLEYEMNRQLQADFGVSLAFSDFEDAAADELADLLGEVNQTILRKGTLPRPRLTGHVGQIWTSPPSTKSSLPVM
jgi:hypothetical protein